MAWRESLRPPQEAREMGGGREREKKETADNRCIVAHASDKDGIFPRGTG